MARAAPPNTRRVPVAHHLTHRSPNTTYRSPPPTTHTAARTRPTPSPAGPPPPIAADPDSANAYDGSAGPALPRHQFERMGNRNHPLHPWRRRQGFQFITTPGPDGRNDCLLFATCDLRLITEFLDPRNNVCDLF